MSVPISREKAVFDAALEVTDPVQRKSFLDQACAGDAELRAAVEELLATQGDAEEFFAESASSLTTLAGELESAVAPAEQRNEPTFEEKPGTIIGRYKLLQMIGEGGYGVVYMAEQEQPVRRRVALKVIKLGMDTKNVIARFEAERQALAMMDHSNIARVFDAGATETGRPYFVMELVHGVKITEYCDQNQLALVPRLELFIQICHAIQHAHQKGIIHRDIKPSNILVTLHDGVPVPKVIDFGIAKATEERLTDKTLFTAFAQLIGTPAYMSPEQVELSGLGVDTRSDIYSLGVLLYELLTGKTPFDTKELLKSGVDEMRRTLREREPGTPSSKLRTLNGEELTKTAKQRHVEPPQLLSQLRGDLDWIVLKALEKDRNRRYETAIGLAMDIQRYLDDEPVLARPPSNWYRLQKLVRRNRIMFLAGCAVGAALLIGIITSTLLLIKERAALRRAVSAQQEAESALHEAELQRKAELRGRITQAALLIAQGKYQEADRLVGGIPLNKPLADPAVVFRSLGYWHALEGRWPLAVERLETLIGMDQSDKLDVVTLDYTALGTALIASGDLNGYDRFRQTAILRFTGTNNLFPDRIIKFCLLSPANQQMMQELHARADFVEKQILTETNGPGSSLAPWHEEALSLFEYRQGDYAKAADWSRRCLAYPAPDYAAGRSAAANAILAMSCWQMSQRDEALLALRQGQGVVEVKYKPGTNKAIAPKGIWYDVDFGRILLREATGLLANMPSQTNSPAQ